jgi:hypothetical protein
MHCGADVFLRGNPFMNLQDLRKDHLLEILATQTSVPQGGKTIREQ